MARITDYATYYGAEFPAENEVASGVVYGPTGDEFEGTAPSLETVESQLDSLTATLNRLGVQVI